MNTIRLLDIDKDMPIIKTAWRWKNSSPKWFREMMSIYKEPWKEYIQNFPNELHYGVFTDDEPQAIIRLIEAHAFVFNIHLSAKRKADFNVLLQAGESVRDYLFDHGVNGFYGHVSSLNRGVCKLYESLGFTDTGKRTVKGKIRGKDVVWKQYAIVSDKFVVKYGEIT